MEKWLEDTRPKENLLLSSELLKSQVMFQLLQKEIIPLKSLEKESNSLFYKKESDLQKRLSELYSKPQDLILLHKDKNLSYLI